MLNKNQSKKKNLLKYAVIIPALFVFVMLFQVKVIAQEVKTIKSNLKQPNSELLSVIIYKNSSNDDLKKNTEMLSETKKVTLKFSKIKRNSIGEIIAIKIDYKDNQTGKSGSNYINSSDPIQPIYFYKTDTLIGISNIDKLKPDNDLIELEELKKLNSTTKIIENRIAENNEIKPNETNIDQPIAPEAPTPPIAPVINFNSATFPNLPKAPTAPNGTPLNNKKEWDKFEKKMEEFEKKMKTIEPEIEAYAEKMSNLDEQMKPYEKQMEAFEKQMEVFEKQMDEYQDKMEAYQKKMHLQK